MVQVLPSRRAFAGMVASTLLATGAARAQVTGTGQALTLLTGPSGGTFFEYGPALARVSAAHAGVELDVQTTGGSNDNLRSLARGDADLGLVNMGPAWAAWEGRHPFAAEGALRGLRALFPMYETPFALVATKASGIARLADLSGRRVGVGPAGGPGQVFFAGLVKELALPVRIVTGAPGDLVRRLREGEIDAFWYGIGLPVAAVAEALEGGDAVMFGLGSDEIAALRHAFPFFTPLSIPAGRYEGQEAPLTTAAVWNFVLASDRLADEPAYRLTRAAMEHAGEMATDLPAAAGTALGNVEADTFLPFHPGAARYYGERGLKLPAELAPT